MKTIKTFVKSHPVLTYFALTFAISWGGMLLVMVAVPGGFPGTREQVETRLNFAMLAWTAGPPLPGILLTGLLYGREGFRNLLTRMTRWRVSAHWYAVALLSAPLLFMVVPLALSLRSPEFLPGIFITSDLAYVLLFGIGWGLIGGGHLRGTRLDGLRHTQDEAALRCAWYGTLHRGSVGSVALAPGLLGKRRYLRSSLPGPLAGQCGRRYPCGVTGSL